MIIFLVIILYCRNQDQEVIMKKVLIYFIIFIPILIYSISEEGFKNYNIYTNTNLFNK